MRVRHVRRAVSSAVGTALIALGGVVVGPIASGAAVAPHQVTTLTVAQPVDSDPTSVFPFLDGVTCQTVNAVYLDEMYRPGYWYGDGSAVTLQPGLSSLTTASIAYAGAGPSQTTTVTIDVKPWVWSNTNGALDSTNSETLDNQMVDFWLNMDKAQSSASDIEDSLAACGDDPPFGLPGDLQQVVNVGGATGHQVQLTFGGYLNSGWLQGNELSQINPMPWAWDISAGGQSPGAGGCSTESYAAVTNDGSDPCTAVFNYLSGLQINSSIWRWADGPYRQTSAQYVNGLPAGLDVQVANAHYSGPASDHAHAAKTIDYKPFATEAAEEAQLTSGALDVGYAEPTDLTAGPANSCGAGANRSGVFGDHYNADAACEDGDFFLYINFGGGSSTWPVDPTTTVWAAELNQQYVRAALEESIDQPSIDASVFNGYAEPTTSAIPTMYPALPYASGVTNPYPFSESAATQTLTDNGWVQNGDGFEWCEYPGTSSVELSPSLTIQECGANIPYHATLSLNIAVADENSYEVQMMLAEQQTMEAVGFDISLTVEPVDDLSNACFGGASMWEICTYGGWIYDPDFYPSAEQYLLSSSPVDIGGYSSSTMDTLIGDTISTSTALNGVVPGVGPGAGTSFAQWTATDLPLLWEPAPKLIVEVKKSVVGLPAASPFQNLSPEFVTSI